MDVLGTAWGLATTYGLLIIAAILLYAAWGAARAASKRAGSTWGLTGVFVGLVFAGVAAFALLSPALGAAMILLGTVLAIVSAVRHRRW